MKERKYVITIRKVARLIHGYHIDEQESRNMRRQNRTDQNRITPRRTLRLYDKSYMTRDMALGRACAGAGNSEQVLPGRIENGKKTRSEL
jgi:hypothetical protein